MKKNNLRFAFGAILFFAGWWAAIDNADYFPQVLDPNNIVLGVPLPHHWVVGFAFILVGLGIMVKEVIR